MGSSNDNAGHLLSDIRVIEVASLIMAPTAATILADFGADVIKVEDPGGDGLRRLHLIPGMPESEVPFCYVQINRNKRGIVLNLKHADGQAILHRLIESADIFISNYRPAAIEKLELTYEKLSKVNPKLIYAHASGFGTEGPDAHRPGYDTVCYFARSGIETHLFPHDGWLSNYPPGTGDQPTGMALYGAIMTALLHRERTGKGTDVSTSLIANGVWANACMLQAQYCGANFLEKRPHENAYNFTSLHYRLSDGRIIRLTVVNIERDWARFCQAMGLEELTDDPRFCELKARRQHMQEWIAILDRRFGEHDAEKWTDRLDRHDIPFALLPKNYADVANDPQLEANDVVLEYDHPKLGKLKTIDTPFTLRDVPKREPTAPPELGEHSREVLAELGYDPDTTEGLITSGAVGAPEPE
jgi:crotonobetainyl-CoA:carnitine CoA-transferase CaiB-like acyl-CoA transferase